MAEGQEAGQDNTWLVDMVVQFMHSPSWNEQLATFINDKCTMFDNFEEENKHEYVEVHSQFKALIDNLLTAHLLEVDILPEDFERQCIEAGLAENPRLQQVVSQLIAAEDFITFKQMMIEHHTNMQHQAESNFKDLTTAQEVTAAEIAAAEFAAAEAAAAAAAPIAAAPIVADPVASAASAAPGAPAPLPPPPAQAGKAITAAQERAFGAGGGFYGRAAMPSGANKPASNEKAAAIRKALVASLRPK